MQEMECGNRLNEKGSEIIFVPGINGIPEWVKGYIEGSQIGIGLPKDWYQDKHFLGIAIGCTYSSVDGESYR